MTSTSNDLVHKIRLATSELEMKKVIEDSLSLNRNDKIKFTTLTIISLRVIQTELPDPSMEQNIVKGIELLKRYRQQFHEF